MLKLNILYSLVLTLVFVSNSSYGLTFKTGQVIGSDGNLYDGASEQTKQKLRRNYNEGAGEQVGVINNNLFIIYEDDVLFVPMSDLAGKNDESIDKIINEKFTSFERRKDITLASKENFPEQDQAIVQAQDRSKDLAKSQTKDQARFQAKSQAKDQAKAQAKSQAKSQAKNRAQGSSGKTSTGSKPKPK